MAASERIYKVIRFPHRGRRHRLKDAVTSDLDAVFRQRSHVAPGRNSAKFRFSSPFHHRLYRCVMQTYALAVYHIVSHRGGRFGLVSIAHVGFIAPHRSVRYIQWEDEICKGVAVTAHVGVTAPLCDKKIESGIDSKPTTQLCDVR